MNLHNAVVLITGANRGLGLAFAKEALARGARKVYAGARDPDSVTLPGVIPVRLDVNRPEDVAAAAQERFSRRKHDPICRPRLRRRRWRMPPVP